MPSISVEDREKSGWFFSCLAQRSLLLPTEASNIRYPNSRVQNGIQAAMKSEPSAVALCGGNQLGSYCDFFHFFLFYIRWFTATYCDKLSTERNRNDLRGAELFTQYYQMCVLNTRYLIIQIFTFSLIQMRVCRPAGFYLDENRQESPWLVFFSIYTSWSVCWVDRRLSAHVGW